MSGSEEVIGEHMSTAPLSIQLDAELAEAIMLMQRYDIRHLPVLDGERLVGVVSERDITVIESLVPDEWERIVVAEAMTPSPYSVSVDAPLAEVAATMAEHKYGCVVVTGQDGSLLGLFTTTDALNVLAGEAPSRPIGHFMKRTAGLR